MHELLHLITHSFEDTWTMIPLLFLSYLVIEHIERKESNDDFLFRGLQKYGPLFGALVGTIPQCGFSIIAAMLFISNNITLGTLLSVFIVTSDEAIPILLSNPSLYSSIGSILIIKIITAVLVGYFTDKVLFRRQKLLLFADMAEYESDNLDDEDNEDDSSNACPCCYPQFPLPVSALLRTLKIYVFLFLTTLILTCLIHYIGEDTLSTYLMQNNFLQPIFAALFGFIPNCAASVVLTQLYVAKHLTFASLISGLIANAGLGFVVLIRYQAGKKKIFTIFTILFLTAILAGTVCTFLM